jgi:hypothetical protein
MKSIIISLGPEYFNPMTTLWEKKEWESALVTLGFI